MTSMETTATFSLSNKTINAKVPTVHINGTYAKTRTSYGPKLLVGYIIMSVQWVL